MQQVIQNEDLVKKIRSFDKYTYWYHKEIFDRIIKEIDVKTKMYYQISEECLEAVNDMFKEIENDSKGMNSLYFGYVDTHIGFITKYLNKPHKYLLECIKRKELALWN